MKIEYITGDLFENGETVCAHGVNCMGVMGAGIANVVRTRFPIVFEKYEKAYEAGVLNLGYAQFVRDTVNDICMYNLCTQRQMGPNATLWGVFLSFSNMFEHARGNNIERVACPRIGAKIGGLQWLDVEEKIYLAHEATKSDVQIAVYTLAAEVPYFS